MKQLVTYLLICIAGGAFAQDNSMFQVANEEYNTGEFKAALESYKAVLSKGELSPQVYYNMGNCYYRLDRNTEAIYYYERALKLDPSDEDVEHNLQLAYARTIDKIEPLPEWELTRSYKNLALSSSADFWAIAFLITFALGFILFILYIYAHAVSMKRVFFFSGFAGVIFSVFFLILALSHQSILSNADSAIVFAPSITAKSAPTGQSKNLFVLHEGAKVGVDSKKNEWAEIRLPNGNKGWVPMSSIKEI